MIESNSSVQLAKLLLELNKEYLLQIQSDEEWFRDVDSFIGKQQELINRIRALMTEEMPSVEMRELKKLIQKCYQFEVQINSEVNRQHAIVAREIGHIRKGNRLKSTYDVSGYGSGVLLDTYK